MSYRNDFNNYLISSNNPPPNYNFNSSANNPQNINHSAANLINNPNNTSYIHRHYNSNIVNNHVDFLSNNTNMSAYSNNSNSQELNSTDINSKYNQYKRNLSFTKNNSNSSLIMNHNFNSNVINNPTYDAANLDQNFLNNHLISNILPENDNDNEHFDKLKYTNLKKLYDERIKSLYNQLRLICKRFESDEILNTMKNDMNQANQEFTLQRLKEIIDDNFISEKEDLISSYQTEISELNSQINYLNKALNEKITKYNIDFQEFGNKVKNYEALLQDSCQKNEALSNELLNYKNQAQLLQDNFDNELNKLSDDYLNRSSKINNDLQKIKSDNIALQDHIALLESKYKEIHQENDENKLEMDRLQKVISVLEIDLNVNEGKIKEKQGKIDSLQQENTNLQTQYFEINLKSKKFMDENKNLESLVEHYEKERRELLDKYNNFNEDLQKSHHEKLEIQEKKYKEKYGNLKKKIIELKSIISNLEEELNLEKNNALDTKINYSKIITKMQEDMKLIKTEWEKKCKDQAMDYEKIISDFEAKTAIDFNTVKQDLISEIEIKNKEILKYKQSSDLLKNFEKEFIRITKHEEILNETLNEMKKKFNQEMFLKEEELENELRKRLAKLDEDKKGEYEFLTDNTRKTLKNYEKQNEELKSENLELQNKLNLEKANNEVLNTNNLNQQKTIRQFKMEIDEKNNQICTLKLWRNLPTTYGENYSKSEESNKNLTQSVKTLQINLENITNKFSNLEREKNEIVKDMKIKETYHKEEILKLEKELQNIKENEGERFEKEYDNHLKSKTKIKEYESIIEQLQNDSNFLLNKNADLDKNYSMLDNAYETLNKKNKEQQEFINSLEKQTVEITKKFKNFQFEHNNSNELVIKLLKTKLNTIRSEIISTKLFYNNEINNIKKEHSKVLENLFNKIKIFSVGFEKEKNTVAKSVKESMEKEFKQKLNEKDVESHNDLNKIVQKYENNIIDYVKQLEKKEKENKSLADQIYESHLKFKEMNFKNVELEQENKNLNNQINKLKAEMDSLNEALEKTHQEKIHLNKQKNQLDDLNEISKREAVKRVQTNLTNLLSILNKTKKKYNQEIYKISTELEKLQNSYEIDKKAIFAHIQRLENDIIDEKEKEFKLIKELEKRESELKNINKNIETLKDVYENKINLLNTKINSDDDNINELKIEIKNKNDNIKELNYANQESKNKMKNIKTQLEMKNDEINNIKKEYEKLLNGKDKKINELKNIINQSFYSLNSGLNNIKIANKLDDEVKVLMKKAKIDDLDK